MTENSDEEQEEHPCELIVNWTRVHGPVALQESCAQNLDVLPLQQKADMVDDGRTERKKERKRRIFSFIIILYNILVLLVLYATF